jgi:hypothetical protein
LGPARRVSRTGRVTPVRDRDGRPASRSPAHAAGRPGLRS